MRAASRTIPNEPASRVLTPLQTQVLRALHNRRNPKLQLPEHITVHQAMHAIARLAGHFKSNGEPGWQVLGRGWRQLRDAVEGAAAIHGLDPPTLH